MSENIPEDGNSTNNLPEAGVLLPSSLSSKESLSPWKTRAGQWGEVTLGWWDGRGVY